jgi:predicted CopG family antitoxin
MGKTTIQIEEETRELLFDMGKKGESYDDIIRRLIKKKEPAKL